MEKNIEIDVHNTTPAQFKELKKLIEAEQKNRGATGAFKLDVNTTGLTDLVATIENFAQANGTNEVEVLEACLRILKVPYHVVSNERKKAEVNTGKAVSVPNYHL